MKSYIFSLNIWNAMSLQQRQNILNRIGRNSILAARTFSYIPREIRQDLQKTPELRFS